jgi:hypothetical protein
VHVAVDHEVLLAVLLVHEVLPTRAVCTTWMRPGRSRGTRRRPPDWRT